MRPALKDFKEKHLLKGAAKYLLYPLALGKRFPRNAVFESIRSCSSLKEKFYGRGDLEF
jgi:hypothetical protein